jgi:transposase
VRWKRWRKSLKSKQDPLDYQDKAERLLEIQRLESQKHIDIFYGDETGFSLNSCIPYGWQYPGEPVGVCPIRSKRINVLGLMSSDNRLATFQKEGSIKTDFIVESLDKWVKTLTKPTVLVLDNGPVHVSKHFLAQLQRWQQQDLFIFFLPKYSPHLNKIETLWRKIKYEWLKAQDYACQQTLQNALDTIFRQFGQYYNIKFKELIL